MNKELNYTPAFAWLLAASLCGAAMLHAFVDEEECAPLEDQTSAGTICGSSLLSCNDPDNGDCAVQHPECQHYDITGLVDLCPATITQLSIGGDAKVTIVGAPFEHDYSVDLNPDCDEEVIEVSMKLYDNADQIVGSVTTAFSCVDC